MDMTDGTLGDNFFSNIHNINTDTILAIQKDLEPYDTISLVFLLYDIPDTALQRLIVHERICTDVSADNMNLLYEWALRARIHPTWKYEFLEALAICRLYHIIRKLGYNVSNVKQYYLSENTYVNKYINPFKKVLYRLSENITQEEFEKLKKTLISYGLKITDHQTCELLLLELMCQKFIKIPEYDAKRHVFTQVSNIQKFANIIDYFCNLKQYAVCLREIEDEINNVNNIEKKSINSLRDKCKLDSSENKPKSCNSEMQEIFEDLNQLCMSENVLENLKSDMKLLPDAYPIKNKSRIGVCCIINQEYFTLSKKNIELGLAQRNLDNRHGSSKDLKSLETTMAALNFKVITKSNLDHRETIIFIKDVIKHVLPNDSVFMLCILSHGVKGHVYAADSVKIKVQDIQNILDSDEAVHLYGLPKVMIIQACQVDDDSTTPNIPLVTDGPNPSFYLKKSHFLVYWATAPEYEAFRHEQDGSLCIQFLCSMLKKKGKSEQLSDILTQVTDHVTTLCTHLKKAQVPIFESTLRKKLYLYHPD